MRKTIIIEMIDVNASFKSKGYTVEEIVCILTGLVSIWRVNDNIPDITREVIMSELEEDDLTAAFLWNTVSNSLIEAGLHVRELSLKHIIIRWSVTPLAIILEFEDGNQTS